MPYVPGFAHDVFVSYAHGPKPLAGFRGMRSDFISKWTQSLVDDLSSQLDVFLGTKDQKRRVSIWMDPALDGNYPLSQNINAKIKQSAILLVVMSDFYLDSPWCLDELKWFSDHAASNDRILSLRRSIQVLSDGRPRSSPTAILSPATPSTRLNIPTIPANRSDGRSPMRPRKPIGRRFGPLPMPWRRN